MTTLDGPEMPQAGGADADDRGATTENAAADALTCIRPAYTLASHDSNANEVDNLMVERFLHALADISLAVASRKVKP